MVGGQYAHDFHVGGSQVDKVYQGVDLVWEPPFGEPWSLVEAYYTGKNVILGTIEAEPQGIFISPDGTKLYTIGNSDPGTGDKVSQFTMSTPWDISTATYDGIQKIVGTQGLNPTSLSFNNDGTLMFMLDFSSGRVYEYSLSTPWNVSTATYTGNNLNVLARDSILLGMNFSPDGTKLFFVGFTTFAVYQYSLSSAWDITTATYDSKSFSVNPETNEPNELFFSDDGSRMFVLENGSTGNERVYQYELPNPWDLSGAYYSHVLLDISSQATTPRGMFMSPDGLKLYATNALNSASSGIYQYELFYANRMWSAGFDINGNLGQGTNGVNLGNLTVIGAENNWRSISAGAGHSLAINSRGELYSWGNNDTGQTGLATFSGATLSPTKVGMFDNWQSVFAGYINTFAINNLGELYAFGLNANYQLGLGDTTNRNVPTKVGVATNWIKAEGSGDGFSIALNSDGELWAVGKNTAGQLGLGDTTQRTSFTKIGSANNWIDFATGWQHVIALNADGELWAWGSNAEGRTGQGTTVGNSLSPVQIGVATDWAAIAVGDYMSVALKTDNTMYSWGMNAAARTGQGTTSGNTLTPTQIGTDTDWAIIACSKTGPAGYAIKTDGELWAWGNQDFGRLGNGNTGSGTVLSPALSNTGPWLDVKGGGSFVIASSTP